MKKFYFCGFVNLYYKSTFICPNSTNQNAKRNQKEAKRKEESLYDSYNGSI
jgi:hypothetical protein